MINQRYQIKDEIGRGGLGVVYRAEDTTLGREVAIKRVLIDSADPVGELTENLTREARVLSALKHPNIVTVHDVGVDEEGAFVVMELLEGETLDTIIERAPLPVPDFEELAVQALEGMSAAQSAGLLHRDLKPANLMLVRLPSGKFQVKILDFGLAKFSRAPTTQTMNHEDSIMGSIYFLAPEQFEQAPLDPRTDLYSLGAIFYFTLAGNYPFQGDSAVEVMSAHLFHRVVPLQLVRPDVPESVCQWIDSLMARMPDDRPSDAREALDSLSLEPVLNEAQIRETSSNDATLAAELVAEFRNEISALIDQLNRQIEAGQNADAAETARMMRGTASTLGYLEIISLAREIEGNASTDPERCRIVANKIPQAIERLSRAVDSIRWNNENEKQ